MENTKHEYDIVIIGGLGHVGLPLGLSFANEGLNVCLYDVSEKNADLVRQGIMPFIEYGAEPILKEVLANGKLTISLEPSDIAKGKNVIVAIGTPVDEYLSPKTQPFFDLFRDIRAYLSPEQTIIIRSTVFPRTCRQITKVLGEKDGPWHIAYCPERIIQGYSIKELKELPQIVSGITDEAQDNAQELFSVLSPKIIRTSIEEAELAKLFTNAWRYTQFAMANQFYMICKNFDVDYNSIRNVMMDSYGRVASLPTAGFAAGPCLLKDTMQLMASCNNNFFLGNAAMMVNEGLPNFIVDELKTRHDLSEKKVGVLGMAFKADIDDTRDSLSYKIAKLLRFNGAEVYCSDHYVQDDRLVSEDELLAKCDIIIIGVPHTKYRELRMPADLEVIDLWGVIQNKNEAESKSEAVSAKV